MKKRKNNNGIFYVVISLFAVFAIAGSVAAYVVSQNVQVDGDYNYYEAEGQEAPEEVNLGAFPGGDIYNRVNMHSGYQSGGDVHATTTTGSSFTLTSTELGGDITFINWNAGLNTTLTTMATTSSGFYFMGIPNAGDKRSYYLYSATSTTAATITIAAGTGVDLQKNEDTADLAINGLDVAKLTFIRKPDTDVMLIMEEWVVGD